MAGPVLLVLAIIIFLASIFTGGFLVRLLALACLGLAVAMFIMVRVFKKVAHSDGLTKGGMAFMEDYERRLFNLMSDSKNADFSAELKRSYESVKYADKVGFTVQDTYIEMALDSLERAFALEGEERAQANIPAIFDELKTALTRRQAEMREAKRGGF